MPATFKDHFSHQSNNYARHRPRYPSALFDYLASLTAAHTLAVDVATGNGQAAVALKAHYDAVHAIDASANQIAAAEACSGVTYCTASAEKTGLATSSADLICVAQAFHWFDADAFFGESQRVLHEDGVLAIWLYEIAEVDSLCDAVIDRLYTDIVGPFWPAERQMIDAGYADVLLPGRIIDAPSLRMSAEWTADDMLGYLRTWSACKRYRQEHGSDPVDQIEDGLRQNWGDSAKLVSWPLPLKVCRPNKPARIASA